MLTSSKHSPCVGIRTCSDYSPFGVELDGRTVSGGYRFGFQGSEKDNEFKGNGNSYTTEFRQLDPRLGRWLSVDPLFAKFSWQSPYVSLDNNSILLLDKLGTETSVGPGDRVKAAKQFLTSKTGYQYSVFKDNIGRENRTSFKKEALEKQDCVELVTRVLYADGVIKSMNIGKYDYYLASKSSIGNLLFDESKFIQSNTPQIGDIAFWEGHVGIVSKVGKSNKFKLVHAANTRSDIIENPHFINASKYSSGTFYGFFRPVNETPDGKIIDITKDNNLGVAKESMYQSPGLVKDIIVTNKITQPIIIDEN